MRVYTRLLAWAVLAGCVLPLSLAYGWDCGFESGAGRNGLAIGTGIVGLSFSTVQGGDVCFADINSGSYNMRSSNGKSYESGRYSINGDIAAFVANTSDHAKISFTEGQATIFSLHYSSEFGLVLEAYDCSDSLIASASGPSNVGLGTTNLLTVTGSSIAYVIIHDEGGYWFVDDISTDAPVPEPSSGLLLSLGLCSTFTTVLAKTHRRD